MLDRRGTVGIRASLRKVAAVVGAVSVLLGNRGTAAVYSVEDLGVLTNTGGREDAKPIAINADGSVAASNVTGGAYRAWIFGGSWTNLGTLGGGESIAGGINDADQVAGYSQTSGGSTRAFLWTPGGADGVAGNPQMKDLGTLGGTNSEAYDVNNLGQVTGYAQTANRFQAFVYAGGTMTDIGQLSNAFPNSFGYAINDSGHVVGAAYDGNFSAWRAFLYNGATLTQIGNLGGGNSVAMGINESNHVVGYASTASGVDHAFHQAAGVTTDLGTLGGGYSYGLDINNAGLIVGGSFVDPANTVYHAFLSRSNTMTDLNTLLDASGAGWTLVEARSINDQGQIVGVGRFAGSDRGFRLTPSNPSPVPSITEIRLSSSDVLITFTTVATASYTLESTGALNPDAWTDVRTGIAGNGGVVTTAHPGGADATNHFYRIRLESP